MEEDESEPRIQRTRIGIMTQRKATRQKRAARNESVGAPAKRANDNGEDDDEKRSSFNDVTLIHRADRLPKDERVLSNNLNGNLGKSPHYTCLYCKSSFFSAVKLKMHFLVEHRVLHCKMCDVLIENEGEMRQHNERVHAVSVCEVCQVVVEEGMDAHYASAHDAIVCRYCDVLLLPRAHYEKHLVEKHGVLESFLKSDRDDFIENIRGATFHCRLCAKSRNREMFGHYVFHHKLNVYYLAACFLRGNVEVQLSLLGEEESEELRAGLRKRECCTVCAGPYNELAPRALHRIFCQGVLCCHLCERVLRKGESLEKHVSRKHAVSCTLCPHFKPTSSDELNAHYADVHALTLCTLCDRGVSDLPQHLGEEHNAGETRGDQLSSLKYELLKSDRSYKESLQTKSAPLLNAPSMNYTTGENSLNTPFNNETNLQPGKSNLNLQYSPNESGLTLANPVSGLRLTDAESHLNENGLELLENVKSERTQCEIEAVGSEQTPNEIGDGVRLKQTQNDVQSEREKEARLEQTQIEDQERIKQEPPSPSAHGNQLEGTLNNGECDIKKAPSRTKIIDIEFKERMIVKISEDRTSKIVDIEPEDGTLADETEHSIKTVAIKCNDGRMPLENERQDSVDGECEALETLGGECEPRVNGKLSTEDLMVSSRVSNDESSDDSDEPLSFLKEKARTKTDPAGFERVTTSPTRIKLSETEIDNICYVKAETITNNESTDETIANNGVTKLLVKTGDKINCSLCGQRMNERLGNVRHVLEHYRDGHALRYAKILQLIGQRPQLEAAPESEEKFDESALLTDFSCKHVRCHFSVGLFAGERAHFPCGVCGENQPSYSTYVPHLYDYHGFAIDERVLRCGCCDFGEKHFKLENHLEHFLERPCKVKEVFDCPMCYSGVSADEARRHILEKHRDSLCDFSVTRHGLQCRFCSAAFWERDELERHELSEHLADNKKEFFECYNCCNHFCSIDGIKKHAVPTEMQCAPFDEDLIYECTICTTTYPSIDSIRAHFRDTHPKLTVVFCPAAGCKKWFSVKKYAKQHFFYVHKRKAEETAPSSYDCEICSRVFSTKKSYLLHLKNSHSKGYKCVVCGEKFLTRDLRKHHYSTVHPGEILYECADCLKTFYSKSSLHVHSKLHNDLTSVCNYCGKEFSRIDSFKEHLLIHIGPKHQCTYCPKVFTQKSNLRRHIRLHTGEKPYSCPYCPKKFSDKGACNSHITVHTRDQECYCEVCGKKFSKQQKLKYHMKRHTGEGLFVCEVCQRGFTSQYDLRKHSITHDQQTQIICECGRGFSSEKYLRTHIKVVHDPQKSSQAAKKKKSNFNCYQCLICKNIFSLHSTVLKHLRNIHKMHRNKCKKHLRQLEPEEAASFTPTVLEEQTDSTGRIEVHATAVTSATPETSVELEQPPKDDDRLSEVVAKKPRNRKHKNPSKYLGAITADDDLA